MSLHFETIDNEIKKRVQAVEQDIPADLEKKFTEELDHMAPGSRGREKRRFLSARTLAAAASILLVVFLLVPMLFRKAPITGPAGEEEVSIDYALVDGVPADTYIINPQNSDLTIVWIEKAPLLAQKAQEDNDVPL